MDQAKKKFFWPTHHPTYIGNPVQERHLSVSLICIINDHYPTNVYTIQYILYK